MTKNREIARSPRLTTTECGELEHWSKTVGWSTDYRQVGAGNFDAWFDISLSPDLRSVEQFCSREMCITGTPPPGHIAFVLTHNQGERGRFLGRSLHTDEAMMMCAGSEAVYRTPPNLNLTTVSLNCKRLTRVHAALTGEDLGPLIEKTRSLRFSKPFTDHLTNTFRRRLDSQSPHAGSEIAVAEQDEQVIRLLLTAICAPQKTPSTRIDPKARALYVLRARDYIEAHLQQPLSLAILTHATGVSARTLEKAFQDFLGVTLVRYIKTRRLHAARQSLIKAEPHSGAVTKIALSFGLSHLGYFSHDYKQLFGESPSTTLVQNPSRSSAKSS